MKRTKLVAAVGIVVLYSILLVACKGGRLSNAENTYSYVYTTDPDTLDYTVSNRSTTSDITGNLVDGLLENDRYGNYIPSLAESWSVSDDGLTYTYRLRKNAKWYTAEGDEYADVTAKDFVTGLKHAADAHSDSLYLVQESIIGLDDYIKKDDKDFSKVGIKAVDDYTVEYTLNQPENYWISKTTMGVLFPINEEFLKAQGDDFGRTDPSGILYNGPYLLKSLTSKSSIEFSKNPSYYDAANVHIEKIKLSYYDGTDQESLIKNFSKGVYTVALLYPNNSNFSSVKKRYEDSIIYTPQDATTFYYSFNLNRAVYNHTEKETSTQRAATREAFLNKDFRQAINFSINRSNYSAQKNGEDGSTKNLRNSIVPPNFVMIEGKTFGDVVEKRLISYGDEWRDINLEDAQEGLYSPTKARNEFSKAKEALRSKGIEFPIHIDLPVAQNMTDNVQQSQSVKQSIEQTLGVNNIVIDLQIMSEDEYNNITYFAESSSQQDWDLGRGGWSPDYHDPSTYLAIFNPSNGSMTKLLGFESGQMPEDIISVGLEKYEQLNNEAKLEVNDLNKRYEKYAEAQAWLIDSSLVLPMVSSGASPRVQRTVPFSGAFSWVGQKGGSTYYKYLKLQGNVVKMKEYEEALEQWSTERENS